MNEIYIINNSPLLSPEEKVDLKNRIAKMPAAQRMRILRVLVLYEKKIAAALSDFADG